MSPAVAPANGTTQIRLTADTYSHLLPQVLVDAAEHMDVLLGS